MSGQEFALGDILSVTTGHLVSRDHINGVYRILGYMTGEQLFTHQLPRAAGQCKPVLLVQHPQLAAIECPEFEDADHVYRWLTEQEATYGETLPVDPLLIHDPCDPLTELQAMAPDLRIIASDGQSVDPMGDAIRQAIEGLEADR